MRDKRAAESELDKMSRHIPAEADRLTMVVEEMHSKLCASERERHEALQRLERYLYFHYYQRKFTDHYYYQCFSAYNKK